MKTHFKKLLLPFLFILAFAFTQQVQAQETKEYVTVRFYSSDYEIAYPDGKIEKGKIEHTLKNPEKQTSGLNDIFNMLAKKGYKMVSSNGGDLNMYYIFEK